MNYFAMPSLQTAPASPEMIINRVCKRYKINHADLMKRCRNRELVFARQLIMYAIRRKYKYSLLEIGKIFGKDHTTVMHAIRSIENYLETDSLGKRHEILEFIHSV